MAYIKKRENKKGVSYQVNIRPEHGMPIYKTFKGDKALQQAKKWARIIEGQIADGTFVFESDVVVESKSIENMTAEELMLYKRSHIDTVTDLLMFYKDYIAPNKYSHYEKYITMYEWWMAKIGDVKVKKLTSAILSSCKQILITEEIDKYDNDGNRLCRSPNTINKYLMAMSAPLTFAVKELEIIEVNPMSKIDTMPKPNGRTRFLSSDERILLANSCKKESEVLFLFFLIALQTGARYSEVLTLQVENIDFNNSRVHYLDTKNKTNKGVGINRSLLNMIKSYLTKNQIESGYIFINKKTNKLYYMRGKLEKAIKDAGLKDFHIHDLRHTFASKLAEQGASLLEIAILLGHKSLVMARRYSHLTQQHTDDVARKAAKSMDIDMF